MMMKQQQLRFNSAAMGAAQPAASRGVRAIAARANAGDSGAPRRCVVKAAAAAPISTTTTTTSSFSSSFARGVVSAERRRAVKAAAASSETTATSPAALFGELDEACVAYKKAPPSMKIEFGADVKASFEALRGAGALPKWGASVSALPQRSNVFPGQLRQAGIKSPDKIGVPSVRNDAAFLATTVVGFSVLSLVLGQLPGQFGFWGQYLSGGMIIVVMGIGSTAPALLQVAIDQFSQVFPDYKERVVRHEAAHFLVGYLLGLPITGYSVAMTKEHVEFAETSLGARLITRDLTEQQVDALAAVSVAGIAAEGMEYEEVMGQNADLTDLQRILLRQKPPMSASAQQSTTRWAVWAAAGLLKRHKAEFEALQKALAAGESVAGCVRAIEEAKGDEAPAVASSA